MLEPLVDNSFGFTVSAVQVEDFIARYGNLEALELSQLDDPNATVVNRARIEVALEDAQCWLASWLRASSLTARELVMPSAKRVICCQARYLLDTLRRRTVVVEEYDAMIKELERTSQQAAELSRWRGASPGSRLVRIGHRRHAQYTQQNMASYRALGEEYTNFPELPDGEPCPHVTEPAGELLQTIDNDGEF